VRRNKLFRAQITALVCVGLLLSQSVVLADNIPQAKVTDVALTAGGTLTGQVVDQQGIAKAGVQVAVRQGRQTLATVTDHAGFFRLSGLRGGTCQVMAGQRQAAYRVWAVNTAPPIAQSSVMLVSRDWLVRGANDCDTGYGGGGHGGGLFSGGWGPWVLPALAAGGIITGVAVATSNTSTAPASP